MIREFVNQTYTKRYNKYISDDKLTLIWSLSNGLLPLGGSFGGLITGVVVQNFGPSEFFFLYFITVNFNFYQNYLGKNQ